MSLCWIQLWRNVNKYRFDRSGSTWEYKTIIFADNGIASYNSAFIHALPIPNGLNGKKFQLKGYKYGLLHFQFVNWRNLLIKQAWYRCLERIRYIHKTDHAINYTYAESKNERNLSLHSSRPEWFSGYDFFDSSIFDALELWREKMIIGWFNQYGKNHFKGLDIWDVNWGAGLNLGL